MHGFPQKGSKKSFCVLGVGTPPPDDTWRASLSGATPSGLPKRTRGTLPYPDSPGEAHGTRKHHPATAHVLPPAERKDRSDGNSPPTIFDSHLQGRLNQNSILVESMRPLGSYVDHWDARHQHWRHLWESSDSVDGKDVHTFQKPLVG
ncbi:hypothetical protein CK203_076711 [Vitis vinifera]|uniref:Uncharacterized protein n=1 Tax=Vitis vinifera TaxID=29760 RepID=A0A438EPJ2_VITVI|nr:hypothetical protein CK203_076711 [Vitis vinifera]